MRTRIPGHLQGQVVGRNQLVTIISRVIRNRPDIVTGIEAIRVRHVVLIQHGALNIEHVSRVTHVAHQRSVHLTVALHRARENTLPRLQHRILLIPRVQGHRTVIRVHGSLHRVTDVVHRVRTLSTRSGCRVLGATLRVGELIARGVGIHDPLHAVIHNRRVRLRIHAQVRRHLTHTIQRVAFVQDLRALTHRIRKQNVRGLELNRVGQASQQRINARTTVTGESVLRIGGVGFLSGKRTVQLQGVALTAHNRILRRAHAKVNTRLIILAQGTGRFNTGLQELRVTRRIHLVTVGGNHAVTVGVHHVAVIPGIAARLRRVELTSRQHRILRGVTHRIAVHRQLRIKTVVRTELLHLSKRRGHNIRIQQTDIRNGRARRAQRTGTGINRRVIRSGLNLVQTVRVTGRINIALNKLRLSTLLIRNHLETLNNPRVQAASNHGNNHQHRGANQRQTPTIYRSRHHKHDRHQQSRNRQNSVHRDRRVHIRVHCASPAAHLLLSRGITIQPEAHRTSQQKHSHHNRSVTAECRRGTHTTGLNLNTAVEVVHEQTRERRQHHSGGHQSHHHAEERQRKQEEPVIQTELGVSLTEGLLVEEQRDGAPLSHRRRSNEQAQQ